MPETKGVYLSEDAVHVWRHVAPHPRRCAREGAVHDAECLVPGVNGCGAVGCGLGVLAACSDLLLLEAEILRNNTLSLIMSQITLHKDGKQGGTDMCQRRGKRDVGADVASHTAQQAQGCVKKQHEASVPPGAHRCTHLVISSPSRSTTGLATLILSAAILASAAVASARCQGATHWWSGTNSAAWMRLPEPRASGWLLGRSRSPIG